MVLMKKKLKLGFSFSRLLQKELQPFKRRVYSVLSTPMILIVVFAVLPCNSSFEREAQQANT